MNTYAVVSVHWNANYLNGLGVLPGENKTVVNVVGVTVELKPKSARKLAKDFKTNFIPSCLLGGIKEVCIHKITENGDSLIVEVV